MAVRKYATLNIYLEIDMITINENELYGIIGGTKIPYIV